jgi:outer membrane protein insertion porin family
MIKYARRSLPIIFMISLMSNAAPHWRVRSVDFVGNETFNDRALRGVMELRPKWPNYKVGYTEFMMRSDLDNLRAFYKSKGYESVDVKVGNVQRDTASGMVRILIAVNEGPRTHVEEVKVSANRFEMKPADIKKLSTKPGQPLIHADVRQDGRRIKDELGNRGFIEAAVEPLVFFDSAENTAAVVFDVKEGPRVAVGNILLEGNKGLADIVVSRELTFERGDTLTLKDIRRSERRLYATGLFNYVQVKADFDSGSTALEYPDSVYDIRVRVIPGDFFRLQSGVGYSTDEGARLSLLTSYRNLFGHGHAITLDGKISQVSQRAEATYLSPWAFYVPLYLETKLYYSRYDRPDLYQGEFNGARLTLGRYTNYNILYNVWAQWENVEWVSAPVSEDAGPDEVPEIPTQSIGGDLIFDSRSDLFNPTSGSYNRVGLEIAGVFGGHSNQFVKTIFDTRWYFNYKLRYFWSTALRVGWAEPYGKSEFVPVQSRFFGGGSNTVRGFDVNKLAVLPNNDPLKGNFYVFANLIDFRFPLFWWINGAAFLDAGNVWTNYADVAGDDGIKGIMEDLRWSAGPGIRVDTPIRLVARLDLGFKLDRRDGESRMVWHFDLGQPF